MSSEKNMLDDETLSKTNNQKNESHRERITRTFCAFYVNRPLTAFALTLSLQISLLVATGLLYVSKYDIFPADFSQVPLNLEKDPTKLRADAFNFVTYDDRIDLLPTVAIPQRQRTIKTSPIEFIYQAKDGNVLQKENLLAIAKFENDLLQNEYYKKICHLDPRTNNCSLPQSVVRLFDGSIRLPNMTLYDPHFDNITYIFNLAYNISSLRPLIAFSFDLKSSIRPGHVVSKHLRSIIFNGLPLKGFENAEDRKKLQKDQMKKFLTDAFSEYLGNIYKAGIGNLKFYYMNLDLFLDALDKQVIWDLFLALGSLTFIFCFVWFQTSSLWITGWAVFGIVTNFFGANLVYRILLDFRYFGIFHVLSVFMILGIGADDVFVFFNTWKLMEKRNFDNLVDRLTATFNSAASAMFVTSFTTAAAFFATAASPLLGVSSFGVFSGLLVIVNYLSVCIYFPSVVVTYHFYWKDSNKCCQPLTIDRSENKDGDTPQDDMSKLFKLVVSWLETTYLERVIMHKKLRWFLLALFLGFSALCVGYTTQLGPDEDQAQVWPKGTNWYDMQQIKLKDFTETGEGLDVIRIYIVWGLRLQDRSSCHFTDFKCKGKTVFDDSFNLNNMQCQDAMLKFCKNLKSLDHASAEQLKIRRSVATGELEVSCFIDEMQKYLQNEASFHYNKYSKGAKQYNLTIPVRPGAVRSLMNTLPLVYNTSALSSSYNRYFEVALGYWLSGGGNPEKKFDFYKYASYMGGTLDKTASRPDSPLSKAQGGIYGNQLRYVAVVVNTSLTGVTLKYNLAKKVFQSWEDYMDKETKNMPMSCRNAFQCTPEWNNWHWLKVQGELLTGARNGIIIGLSLAFPVLVMTTFNWIIGILAILTVGLITLSVVGLIPMIGWSLGVMESINLTLVVGLAVDYAVHLAEGYVQAKHKGRHECVRYMLGHVGVSVIAGACTTLGASAFMLGSNLLFFLQFGIFMFSTIGFSIVYALVFFTIVVGIIGPEGDMGNLKHLFYCKRRGKVKPGKGECIVYENKYGHEMPCTNKLQMAVVS